MIDSQTDGPAFRAALEQIGDFPAIQPDGAGFAGGAGLGEEAQD
jgi:hypothetical protein